MTERRTGGWLSSVVGNLSGFWSRSPAESDTLSGADADSQNSSHEISYEEQTENDLGDDNDGIIIEAVSAGPSTTMPTTSRAQIEATPRRRAVRYLSPSVLSSATRSVTSSDKEARPNVTASRKRAATSGLFQDVELWGNVADAPVMFSAAEPLTGGFFAKRSRSLQRDFTDDKLQPFISPSLFESSAVERSRLEQSFASSFTALNSSLTRPSGSRPYSSVSSLSSKTKAILEQLQKINTPVKEVKRLSSFNLNEQERWASDAFSSAVQKPPRNSMCALSRAQLISNTLASKSTVPYLGRPSHVARKSDLTVSSLHTSQSAESRTDAEPILESDEVLLSKASDSLKTNFSNFLGNSGSGKVSVNTSLKNQTVASEAAYPSVSSDAVESSESVISTSSGPVKATNVFTARVPELGVVSPVKEKNDKGKEVEILRVDGAMFAFAPPMKRGPSVKIHRENIPEKVSRPALSAITEDGVVPPTFESTAQKALDVFLTKQSSDSSKFALKEVVVTDLPDVVKKIKESQPVAQKLPAVKKSVDTWSCPDCMVFNKAGAVKCVCCGHENKLAEPKPWTCSECWVTNKSGEEKCVACGISKQCGGEINKSVEKSQISDTANVFGDRTFKPMAVSKAVSFGFSAAKSTVESGLPFAVPATTSNNFLNSGINGNAGTGCALNFGLTSSISTPNFGLGKSAEIVTSVPIVSEALAPKIPSLTSSVASTSMSAASASPLPTLTRPSLSFPTLTTTVSTTANSTGSIFSFPVTTSVNPFAFGLSSAVEMAKVQTAPLFSFSSPAPSIDVTTTAATAVTSVAPLPSFAPLFGTNGGVASSAGHDAIEMSSPTSSPVTSSVAVGSFGISKAAPLFSFGASNAPSTSSSTGGLFGNIQTTAHNQPTAQSTSLFSFGQQHPQSAPKPFEPPASLMSPPSSFHFGGATSNGGSGFVFGSTAPPTNFAFGAQQPAVNAVSTFNFASAAPSATFGNTVGTAPNFFSVGTTSSSTTARKMLKARRTRK